MDIKCVIITYKFLNVILRQLVRIVRDTYDIIIQKKNKEFDKMTKSIIYFQHEILMYMELKMNKL